MVKTEHKDEDGKDNTRKITRETVIGEAARSSDDAPEIMFGYGLHCLGCGMTAFETIEQGCGAHGMSDEEIDKMVEDLNEAAEKEALGSGDD
ncbi:DUF1858 domain-containing protein [Candidatus Woesearchaeota archaeon]|nr:DUF1858 domain-containing protein [Candidatus Woesearchaeota archaeon]